MNKLKSFLVMFLMAWGVYSAEGEMDFIKGADVSMLKQLEDNGAKFYDENNKETECMTILKNNGVNYIRIRAWVNPVDEKGKIDFAKKYFEALGEHYKDQNIKISFKERISNKQLAALINNA